MMRNTLTNSILTSIILIIIIGSCRNTNLIGDSPKLIAVVDISSESPNYEALRIYQSMSNATVNESIQVRVKEHEGEKNIMTYERYDVLKGYFLADDSLVLILEDTSGYRSRIDTMYLNLTIL